MTTLSDHLSKQQGKVAKQRIKDGEDILTLSTAEVDTFCSSSISNAEEISQRQRQPLHRSLEHFDFRFQYLEEQGRFIAANMPLNCVSPGCHCSYLPPSEDSVSARDIEGDLTNLDLSSAHTINRDVGDVNAPIPEEEEEEDSIDAVSVFDCWTHDLPPESRPNRQFQRESSPHQKSLADFWDEHYTIFTRNIDYIACQLEQALHT